MWRFCRTDASFRLALALRSLGRSPIGLGGALDGPTTPPSKLGVSTDSFYSHKAWFGDRKTFPQEITHPVVGDTNHSISRAFGVLKEDAGVAYRASVIVDDKGIIRAYHVNDTAVGRSPKEVLRTAQALQSGGLCGADWKKGEKFVA